MGEVACIVGCVLFGGDWCCRVGAVVGGAAVGSQVAIELMSYAFSDGNRVSSTS